MVALTRIFFSAHYAWFPRGGSHLIITVLVSDPQSRPRLLPVASSPDPSLEPLEQLGSYSQEPVKHKAGWHKVTCIINFLCSVVELVH